jgi:hypothetical protein
MAASTGRAAIAAAIAIPLVLIGAGSAPAHAGPHCGGQAMIGGIPADPALCLLVPPQTAYIGPEPVPGELTLGPEIDDHLVGAAADAKGDLVLMPPGMEYEPDVCDPDYGCGHQPPH